MAPSFLKFKELRRRSRASFRADQPSDQSHEQSTDASNDESQGTTPTSGSITPPSIRGESDPALHLQLKGSNGVQPRPPLQAVSNTNRFSVSGMSGLGSPVPAQSALPVSQYAPRIANVKENAWVYQKVLLVRGTVGGDAPQQILDGSLTISRLDDNFPPISWPVCDSGFKGLVYLQPGPNRLRFEFSSPKLANSSSTNPIHTSYLTIHMMPSTQAPPLQLAVVLAKDSPGTFDAVPARREREGDGLEVAIRKFRMAAYIWQAFTAEQMWRNKLRRRTFGFEEEWTQGTANHRDREMGTMRSEARIHVIRSEKTLAELRDIERLRLSEGSADNDGLFKVATDAVRDYFKPLPGQKQWVSALLLDAQWDPEAKIVRGHAAAGGNDGDLHVALFGSHCLQSYPTSLEEVVPAFTDCTPVDAAFAAHHGTEAGSSWEVANMGIGAHLHEIGHLFGCPHQEGGVMKRGYVALSRTFIPREAYSNRTRSKGGLVLPDDECTWHRLDCLRFRQHPCFRLPNDGPLHPDGSIQAFPIEGGTVVLMANTGVSFVEIYAQGDDVCHAWLEYPLESGAGPQKQLALCDAELRARLPKEKRQGDMKVCIWSHGGGSIVVGDFKTLCSKKNSLKLENGKMGYRSQKLGLSRTEDSQPVEVILTSAVKQNRVLSRVVFYHDEACGGMEFAYDDNSTQLFGKHDEKSAGSVFELGKQL
jgi:hypothetical protein